MHPQLYDFVKACVGKIALEPDALVLEVGSFQDGNQIQIRKAFSSQYYVGVDIVDGPGVDFYADATCLPFADNQFDLILGLSLLEHVTEFWLVLPELARCTCKTGHIIYNCLDFTWPYHPSPAEDYWRFGPEAGVLLAKQAGLEVRYRVYSTETSVGHGPENKETLILAQKP